MFIPFITISKFCHSMFLLLFFIFQGLHLFNMDIIREHGTLDRYYVIDINYFPGKQNIFYIITLSLSGVKGGSACVVSDPTSFFFLLQFYIREYTSVN